MTQKRLEMIQQQRQRHSGTKSASNAPLSRPPLNRRNETRDTDTAPSQSQTVPPAKITCRVQTAKTDTNTNGLENLPKDRVIDGRYIVGDCLGQGSMGAVYEVQHTRLSKRFAMKIIHHQLSKNKPDVARFHREASALSLLDHPNCVRVTDFGQTSRGDFYIVMDLAEGKSLSSVLCEGPLPVEEAIEITRQVLKGLDHAHSAGIIHRDIKLSNLAKIDNKDGSFTIKILDFGIAKLDRSNIIGDANITVTAAGVVLGTPQYIAPETIVSQLITRQTDLYAVGVTLFRLLVGRLPFWGSDVESIVRAKMNTPAPKLNDVGEGNFPEELEDFLARAMAPPKKRFSSAKEMLEALDRVEKSILEPESVESSSVAGPLANATATFASGIRGAKTYSLDRGRELLEGLVSDYRSWRDHRHSQASTPWVARTADLVVTAHGRHLLSAFLVPLLFFVFAALLTTQTNRQPREVAQAKVMTMPHAETKAQPNRVQAKPSPVVEKEPEEKPVMEFDVFEVEFGAEAEALLSAKNCTAARQLLSSALEAYPNSARGHYLIGNAHMCLGDGSRGLRAYRTAIEKDDRYRSDPKIYEDIRRLIQDPNLQIWAVDFLASQIGAPAQATLINIAEGHPNRKLRNLALDYLQKAGASQKVNHEKRLALEVRQTRSCAKKAKIIDEIAALQTEAAEELLQQLKDAVTLDYWGRKHPAHNCVRPLIKKYLAQMKNGDLSVLAHKD